MKENYRHFLNPLTIRGKTWKNRSVAAPMGLLEIENGRLTERGKQFIDFYSQGDVAEYIVGETDVSAEGSRMPPGKGFELHSLEAQRGLKEAADRIHRNGPLAMLELAHCGALKQAGPQTRIVGPSGGIRETDGAVIHEMTEEDISRTIGDFASAASIIQNCGFDGVVIHAGRQWLPHQFLSPLTNRRTDRFGGSLENRARFLILLLEVVRKAVGEEFILECRLSGSENTEDGYTVEDMCRYAELMQDHCDILHISAGRYYDPVETGMMSSSFDPHGLNVPLAKAVRARVHIPVSVVGGISDPAMCEKIVAEGSADLVIMGRQRLADPLFVRKCREGRADEIRRCIRCMRCFPGPMEHVMAELAARGGMAGIETILAQLSHCTVNPAYFLGAVEEHPKPARKKSVLVIGGGCAGMQAAMTAAERGHDVTLIEKSSRLGGILRFGEADPVKGELAELARTMERQLRRSGAAVRLNTPFSSDILKELSPDAVLAAVGSAVTDRDISGMDGPGVLSAMDAYGADADFGSHAVVIGGGQTGCETAIHIAQKGCAVTLVSKHEELAADAYRLHRLKLQRLIGELGIEVWKNAVCTEVLPQGVVIETAEGEERIPADRVVNALGMKAVSYDGIERACSGREFTAVGDCTGPANICDALEAAYAAALKI